jgi:16S rRNA (uracil1498-N3)-methyltransferase
VVHPVADWAAQARRAAAHALVADVSSPELSGADRHHLLTVLRVRSGESVSVTDGRGGWRLCSLGPDGSLAPAGAVVEVPAPRIPITVAFTPVKGDRPEWAVQKLTELGVDRIVVLATERSVVRWDGDRAERQLQRLREVARQALMQSRQLWLPEVVGVVPFATAAAWPGVALAEPGGPPPGLDRPIVLVGPEGGWSPAESVTDVPRVGLGPAVLRAESAAVVAGVYLTGLRAGLVAPAGG